MKKNPKKSCNFSNIIFSVGIPAWHTEMPANLISHFNHIFNASHAFFSKFTEYYEDLPAIIA